MKKTKLWGMPLTTNVYCADIIDWVTRAIINKNCLLITFINPHAFYLAKKKPRYLEHIKQFDAVLPDGIAVQKAIHRFLKEKSERISFDSSSLALPIFKLCEEKKYRIVLVGGEEGTSKNASKTIRSKFKKINIVGTFNGFIPKRELSVKIILSLPDIVICGMGAPHQEELLLDLKSIGFTGAAFSCGGYLDQLSDGINYYPIWIDRYNLRFAYRIFKEPRRLLKRYFVEYRVFIYNYIIEILKFNK
ncbi:WecB/TagA/CpsF family glycosyltransferase [Pseudomonadales bacterium]|nr:WecB/TagA/CpsF family glycosyltransferase [Pseudomonadales bacterium]